MVEDNSVQNLLVKVGLKREECAQIWELVNPNGDELFTKEMFMMTMHLIAQAKKGVSLPQNIPQELKDSTDPSSKDSASMALVVADVPKVGF